MLSQLQSYYQKGGGHFLLRIKILDIFFNSPIIILDLLPVRHALTARTGLFFLRRGYAH
jgi:hypothetical protein